MASDLWLPLNNTLVDSCPNQSTYVDSGSVFNSSTKKFGTHSYQSGYYSYASYTLPSANTFSSSADFTYMFWMYRTSTSYSTPFDHGSYSSGGGPYFYILGYSIYLYFGTTYVGGVYFSGFNNAWRHIAITRTSGTLRLFIDGTAYVTTSNSQARTDTGPLIIGNKYGGGYSGGTFYLDDFVFDNGNSLYSSNYTPPTSAYSENFPGNSTPTNITLSTTNFNENLSANSTVATISTTDANAGDSHVYSLVSGSGSTDNSAFNISGNNLRISAIPDYETKSSYNIRIRTRDSGNAVYEKAFTLTVNNVVEGGSTSNSGGLPSSGALSLSAISQEFGDVAPHSLSEFYGIVSGIPASGAISFNNFYGKSDTRCFPQGQAVYTGAGTYTWTPPNGLLTVSVFCVGGGGGGGGPYNTSAYIGSGGGGGGGAGVYAHITLQSGAVYKVQVGAGGNGSSSSGQSGGLSGFYMEFTRSVTLSNGSTLATVSNIQGINANSQIFGTGIQANTTASPWSGNYIIMSNSATASGTYTITFRSWLVTANGGSGGSAGVSFGSASGGSGGSVAYGSAGNVGGDGGRGTSYSTVFGYTLVSGGGGGGGGGYGGVYGSSYAGDGAGGSSSASSNNGTGGGGGGFGHGGGGSGLLGQGTAGTPGGSSFAGGGGSLGEDGTLGNVNGSGGNGGLYGAGGGGSSNTGTTGGSGARGAVRIIWGKGRAYPSTRTLGEDTFNCP